MRGPPAFSNIGFMKARAFIRRVASEPLTHFLLLGGLLFGTWSSAAAPPTGTVIVGAATEAWLVEGFEARHGRAPTPEERKGLIEAHVDEEVLYREGIALGLDRGDPIVRRRVVQRMEMLLEDLGPEPPMDDELRAYYDAHAEDYRGADTITVRQVFASGNTSQDRAALLQSHLEAGADPSTLGEAFPHGQLATDQSPRELDERFGAGFALQLEGRPQGEWFLAQSSFGWHAVRIEGRRSAALPSFERVRARVLADWRAEREETERLAALGALRDRYEVRREGTP